MRFASAIFLIASIFAGCSKHAAPSGASESEISTASTPAVEYPRLVIDAQHQIRDKETPPAYQIAATPGIRLDVSQFKFTYGSNAVTPNTVQLILNKNIYELRQPTETNLYMIDHSTLRGVKNSAFLGFHSGDRVMIVIGRSTRGAAKEEVWVCWLGQIEVK